MPEMSEFAMNGNDIIDRALKNDRFQTGEAKTFSLAPIANVDSQNNI